MNIPVPTQKLRNTALHPINLLLVLTCLALYLLPAFTHAHAGTMDDPKHGDPAPQLTLTTLQNEQLNTAQFTNSIQILQFGQTEHEQTQQTIQYIDNALSDPLLQGVSVKWIYILSKGSQPELALSNAQSHKHKPIIVHDIKREAFGAYGIFALPTVVIIDDQNKIVHFMPGLAPRFQDIVADALLLAADKIDLARFNQTLNPQHVEENHAKVRAHRFIKLARHALKRGMDDLARSQYARALEVDPDNTVAHIGLGYVLLKQNKLDDADQAFKALLKSEPGSKDALLGLASVHIARHGDNIDIAESLVQKVLKTDRHNPRAHYIQGLIFLEKADPQNAAISFKKAALLLLNQSAPDQQIRN